MITLLMTSTTELPIHYRAAAAAMFHLTMPAFTPIGCDEIEANLFTRSCLQVSNIPIEILDLKSGSSWSLVLVLWFLLLIPMFGFNFKTLLKMLLQLICQSSQTLFPLSAREALLDKTSFINASIFFLRSTLLISPKSMCLVTVLLMAIYFN